MPTITRPRSLTARIARPPGREVSAFVAIGLALSLSTSCERSTNAAPVAQGVSRQQLDQAEATVHAAEAQVESLRARLREQRVQLQFYEALAPTAGIVGDVPVRVGDRVTPDTLLTTIDTNDALEIHIPVPLERGPQLRRGLAVSVTDASGKEVAQTALSFVSPRADESTQTVLAKAVVHARDSGPRSLQYVRARVVWRSAPGLLVRAVGEMDLHRNGRVVSRVTPAAGGARTPIVCDSSQVRFPPASSPMPVSGWPLVAWAVQP